MYLVVGRNNLTALPSYISNQRVKESIISTSSILGVSTGAIAGAMAEENTAYDFVDEVLDAYAKSGIDPSEALGSGLINCKNQESWLGSVFKLFLPTTRYT